MSAEKGKHLILPLLSDELADRNRAHKKPVEGRNSCRMEEFTEEKRPTTKSGIALKLKRCEKGKVIMPNIKERCASARKALANLSANVAKDVSAEDSAPPTLNVDERILDAALDATAKGQMERASELAARAISQLTPDRMQAIWRAKEQQKARFGLISQNHSMFFYL